MRGDIVKWLVLFATLYLGVAGQDRRGNLLQPVSPEASKGHNWAEPAPDKSGKSIVPLMPPKVQNSNRGKQTNNSDRKEDKSGLRIRTREKGSLGLISQVSSTKTTTTPNPNRPTSRIETGLLKPASSDQNDVSRTTKKQVKITRKPLKSTTLKASTKLLPQTVATQRPSTTQAKLKIHTKRPQTTLSRIPTFKPKPPPARPATTRAANRRPASLLSASRKATTTAQPTGPKKSNYEKSSTVKLVQHWTLSQPIVWMIIACLHHQLL